MPEAINIGILGLGVVGSGTVTLLERNRSAIEEKIGGPFSIRKIAVRDLSKRRAVEVPRALLTSNASEVVDDPDIHIVCELIGGVSPAREYVLRAIENGKHVVSANKELIAKEGQVLLSAADEAGLDFQYEGAVGGGIPIIQPMRNALAGNRVEELMGIVNGTTNYILTRMTHEGAEFESVLKDAQALGYAEADPTSDVEGFDAKYKLSILSTIAFNRRVPLASIFAEGITHIAQRDIECAREHGYVIKLVAVAIQLKDGRIQARVHPALLPNQHPLASTNDVYNAIFVRGDAVGDVMFYGRGAGMMPTGSAVVGDIIEVCRNMRSFATGRVTGAVKQLANVVPMSEVETKYYIRMIVADKPRVLGAVANALGDHDISIRSVRATAVGSEIAEVVWMTHATAEANIRAALNDMKALECVERVNNWLRVED